MTDLTPETMASVPYKDLGSNHVAYLQGLGEDDLATVIREALAQEPPNESLVAAIGGMGIGAGNTIRPVGPSHVDRAQRFGIHIIAQLRLNEALDNRGNL